MLELKKVHNFLALLPFILADFTGITKISSNARKINVGKTIIFISVLATWLALIT